MTRTTKFLGIITVLWMLLIFILSSQSVDNSTSFSNEVTFFILDIIEPGKHEVPNVETKDENNIPLTAEEIEQAKEKAVDEALRPEKEWFGVSRTRFRSFIRKSAHFLLFAVLAVLLNSTAVSYIKKLTIKGVAASFALGAIYAALDEFHQLFVKGRGAMLSDVVIDCKGLAVGTLVFVLFCRLFMLVRKMLKKEKKHI